MFAISFSFLLLLLTETRVESTYLLTIIMKKKAGRPSLGKEAKGELFAVRVNTAEAKQINGAIRGSGQGKPDWLRKALLSAAGSDKSAS
jgi:hypothetical protein